MIFQTVKSEKKYFFFLIYDTGLQYFFKKTFFLLDFSISFIYITKEIIHIIHITQQNMEDSV